MHLQPHEQLPLHRKFMATPTSAEHVGLQVDGNLRKTHALSS